MTNPRNTPLTRFLGTQTTQQLHDIRQEFRTEIDATKLKLEELEEDLEVVEDVIATKSGGQRPKRADSGPPRPALRKTVLEFVGERSGGWTADEIRAELERRGAAPTGKNPRNTLVTRLGEMVNRGELDKRGDLYHLGEGSAAAAKGAAQESLPVNPEREAVKPGGQI
jgi:hypothetical protein